LSTFTLKLIVAQKYYWISIARARARGKDKTKANKDVYGTAILAMKRALQCDRACVVIMPARVVDEPSTSSFVRSRRWDRATAHDGTATVALRLGGDVGRDKRLSYLGVVANCPCLGPDPDPDPRRPIPVAICFELSATHDSGVLGGYRRGNGSEGPCLDSRPHPSPTQSAPLSPAHTSPPPPPNVPFFDYPTWHHV